MHSRFRTVALALTLLVGATAANAQSKKGPKTDTIKDPPGTELYMGQFRLLFDKLDENKDNYLDKEELAKGFRGPSAKPYDAGATTTSPGDSDKKDPDKTEPDKKDTDKKDSDKKPDYSKYPDYNFLIQLDTDKDEKISYDEFMTWARDYSIQLKEQADTQQKLVQSQLNLNKYKKNSPEYRKAEAELRHQQDQLNKLKHKLESYEKHLAHQHHIKAPGQK